MPDPIRPSKDPKYRHYKPKNLAVVRIDGRDHYLGRHNSAESRQLYYRLLAEWRSGGRVEKPAPDDEADAGPTVVEITLAFLTHAQAHYRKADGTMAAEYEKILLSLRPLRKLYGATPARDFGPRELRAVRQSMIDSGLARRTINERVG